MIYNSNLAYHIINCMSKAFITGSTVEPSVHVYSGQNEWIQCIFSFATYVTIYKRDNKSALCAFAIFHEGPWG